MGSKYGEYIHASVQQPLRKQMEKREREREQAGSDVLSNSWRRRERRESEDAGGGRGRLTAAKGEDGEDQADDGVETGEGERKLCGWDHTKELVEETHGW